MWCPALIRAHQAAWVTSHQAARFPGRADLPLRRRRVRGARSGPCWMVRASVIPSRQPAAGIFPSPSGCPAISCPAATFWPRNASDLTEHRSGRPSRRCRSRSRGPRCSQLPPKRRPEGRSRLLARASGCAATSRAGPSRPGPGTAVVAGQALRPGAGCGVPQEGDGAAGPVRPVHGGCRVRSPASRRTARPPGPRRLPRARQQATQAGEDTAGTAHRVHRAALPITWVMSRHRMVLLGPVPRLMATSRARHPASQGPLVRPPPRVPVARAAYPMPRGYPCTCSPGWWAAPPPG